MGSVVQEFGNGLQTVRYGCKFEMTWRSSFWEAHLEEFDAVQTPTISFPFRPGLAFLLFAAALSGAVRGDEAMYVGGTISRIPEKTEGKLDLSPSSAAVFRSKKGEFEIPYKNIASLEYGQKAGRRVGVALAVSPVALLSKKRKHYLSITYVDVSGGKQGAVFELSKGKAHAVIATFEGRSGKRIEFESEEAKKHFEKEGN